jgi:8-hydroxy-5-deazaflavin:NADPH oxidoreductase
MMTTIGILGTGRMGTRLAVEFARLGHNVVLGSRAPERAARIAAGLERTRIRPGDYRAAISADVVLPAIFLRDGLLETLRPFASHLDGKLYVDISNPFNADYSDFVLPWCTSSAEEIQRALPQTRVVGAFKNVWWEVFDAPRFDGLVSDVFVVGDDDHSKRRFLSLAEGMPFRFVDAGPLRNARTVERMTLLSGELGQRLGYFPRMNYRLLGEPKSSGRDGRPAELTAAG